MDTQENNQINSDLSNTSSPVVQRTIASLPINPNSDPASPYFLHAAEGPNLSLVSVMFNGDNYHSWHKATTQSLVAKNKLEIVTGILPRPTDNDALGSAWERCNAMVLSWLLNSIEPSLSSNLTFCDTAAELWKTLHERFTQNNSAEIFRIESNIRSLYQGNMTVTQYYEKLTGLWKELSLVDNDDCTCGSLSRKNMSRQLFHFLVGLNDSFANTRSQILATDPLPTLSIVYSKVKYEETQRKIQVTPSIDNSAFSATGSGPRRPWQRNQAIVGNNQQSRPNYVGSVPNPIGFGGGGFNRFNLGRDRAHSGIKCDVCDGYGHDKSNCFVIVGYPQGYPGRRQTLDDIKRRRARQPQPAASLQVIGPPVDSDVPVDACFAGRYHGDADWSG